MTVIAVQRSFPRHICFVLVCAIVEHIDELNTANDQLRQELSDCYELTQIREEQVGRLEAQAVAFNENIKLASNSTIPVHETMVVGRYAPCRASQFLVRRRPVSMSGIHRGKEANVVRLKGLC